MMIGIVIYGLTSCLPQVESDLQKSMDKDDNC